MLDLITWFDPLKWIDDAYTIGRNGRGVLLEWHAASVTGAQVEGLLRRYGIKVYARKYPNKRDKIAGCRVPSAQAKFADGILRGAGIPVMSRKLSEPIKPRTEWGVTAKAQGIAGMLGDLWGVAPKRKKR